MNPRGLLGSLVPALAWALIVGGALSMPIFERPKAVVPPPAGWEKLGPHPAYSVREFDSLEALQRFCRDNGAIYEPAKRAGDAYAMACTVNALKTIALPSAKAWPNRGEREEMRPHEFSHSWGLRHDHGAKAGGRETWVFADGSPAGPISDATVTMMRKMAERALAAELAGRDGAAPPMKAAEGDGWAVVGAALPPLPGDVPMKGR